MEKYFGIAFNLPAEVVFQAVNLIQHKGHRLSAKQDHYQIVADRIKVKHPLTFLVSLIAYGAVAGIVSILVGLEYAWLGPVALALIPRFWGHSFFNSKDIPFAALFTLCTYLGAYLINHYLKVDSKVRIELNRTNRISVLYGVLVGLLAGVRIGGIALIPFILIAHLGVRLVKGDVYRHFSNLVIPYLLMFGSASAITLLCYPTSWYNPIEWFFEAISALSGHPLHVNVLFDGQVISDQKLPWYFIPKWIAITIPLAFQVSFFCGLVIAVFKYSKFSDLQRACLILVLLQVFFFPIFAIVKHSPLYDEIRQFLFILPGVAAISVASLVWSYKLLPRTKNIKMFLVTASVIISSQIVFDMVSLHPYEYIYFNRVSGGLANAYKRYDTEYWGLSMRPAMEWLNQNDKSKTKVLVGGPLDGAKVFADPSLRVIGVIGNSDTTLAELNRMKISKPYYYLAMPRFNLQSAFPECEVVYQVVRQDVPLTKVKQCG